MKSFVHMVVVLMALSISVMAQTDSVPTVTWASYFGEKRDDRMIDVVRYGDGGVVIVGTTFADSADIVVSRFTADGIRLWTTIIGGEGNDVPTAIVVNKVGEIFVAGHTRSSNNIATRSAYLEVAQGNQDGFIMMFDPTGQRVWGTYIGGTEDDAINDMIQSDRGDLIVVGETASDNLASSDAFQFLRAGGNDGYIGSFTIDGFPNATTYFGGPNDDVLTGVAGDGQGLIYVAGVTASANLATSGAAQEVFGGGATDVVLASFSTVSNLNWCTYVGSTGDESSTGPNIVHANGHLYFCGTTTSTSTIAFPGAYHDTFRGELDGFAMSYSVVSGQKVWGTYLGGREYDEAVSISTDGSDNAVIVGWTKSSADVVTDGAYQTTREGEADAVIWNLSSEGAIRWATYFGGNDIETGASICAIGTDDYIAVGETGSSSGLTVLPPHQANLSSAVNGWYARLSFCVAPSPEITGLDTACLDGQQRTYSTPLIASNTYLWTAPRLGTITSNDRLSSVTINWATIGTDTLFVYETTSSGCLRRARKIVVVADQPDPTISSSTGLFEACEGDTIVLTVKDSTASVLWSTGETTRSINVTQSADLNATISKGACTTVVKGLVVTIKPAPQPQIQGSATVCRDDDAEVVYAVNATSGNTVAWGPLVHGSYVTRTDTSHVRIRWTTIGTDTLRVTETGANGCSATAQIIVTISDALVAVLLSSTGDSVLCTGDSIVLRVDAGFSGHQWSTGETTPTITVRAPGSYFVKVTNGTCTALSDTMNIVERTAPTPQINGPTEICLADTQQGTFTIAPVAGNRIQWEAPILGTTTSVLDQPTLTVDWTTAGTDTIRVHEYAGLACVGSSELVVTIIDAEACSGTILFEVSDVDFGTLPVDSLINATGGHVNEFIVVNRAAFDLSLDSATVDEAVFAVPDQFPRLMRPGDTSRITIRFSPTDRISYTGRLAVYFGAEVGYARVTGTGRDLAPDERITEVILQPDRVEVQPGETFDVIISLGQERPTPTTSTEYEATMQWDARVLELVSTPEVFFRTTGREDNYFTAKIPEGQRLESQRELIRIPFRAKLADVDSTILVFSGATAFRWKDDTKAYPACRDSVVKIRICRDTTERLITRRPMATMITMAPMPADDEVRLTINATGSVPVTIECIDPLGAVVGVHHLGTIHSGSSTHSILVQHLPSGPYILRLLDGWRGDARPLIKQ